jgi:hypothetical protein
MFTKFLSLCQQQLADYLQRPTELCDLDLYCYVKNYEKVKRADEATWPPEAKRFSAEHAQYETHYIRRRKRWCIPDLIGPRVPNREHVSTAAQPGANNKTLINATLYFKITLLLSTPFRTLNDLLSVPNNNNTNNDDDNNMNEDNNNSNNNTNDTNTVKVEYRRWLAAYNHHYPKKNNDMRQLFDNAQLYYDSKRDAASARVRRSAAESAARRAAMANGSAFDDSLIGAGGGTNDGDEMLDGDVTAALREIAKNNDERNRQFGIDNDIIKIGQHLNVNVEQQRDELRPHLLANANDANIDLHRIQHEIERQSRQATLINNNNNNNNNNDQNNDDDDNNQQQQQNQFDFNAARPLTVQLIDEAIASTVASAATATAAAIGDDGASAAALRAALAVKPRPSIDEVSVLFTLNVEQRAAFRIAATAVLAELRYAKEIDDFRIATQQQQQQQQQQSLPQQPTKPQPTSFFSAGAGGCGKSRVIFAIRHLCDAWAVSHYLIVTAFTGCAAVPLKGSTLHSALGMSVDSRTTTTTTTTGATNARIERLKRARMFITDEASMLGPKFLRRCDRHLRTARGVDEPFGGLNMVFVGDFLQLPPVNSTANDNGYDDTSYDQRVWLVPMFWLVVERMHRHVPTGCEQLSHAGRHADLMSMRFVYLSQAKCGTFFSPT